jgi:hypothetical protein
MDKFDIPALRNDPQKFFSMSDEDQKNILNSLFGSANIIYKSEEWPESQFPIIDAAGERMLDNPDLEASGKVLAAKIDRFFMTDMFATVAKLMMFFRIKVFLFPENTYDHFVKFTKVFPRGCFVNTIPRLPARMKWHPMYQWCTNNSKVQLVQLGLRFYMEDPNILQFALESTKCESLDELLHIFSMKSVLDGSQLSLKFVVEAFNQKRLQSGRNRYNKSVVFPCLLPYHFSSLYRKLPKNISRPLWTRQNHKDLTVGTLRREILVILQMQKFRYAQFSLHKDVIDIVIRYIFEAHVIDMENECSAQKVIVQEIMAMPLHEKEVYCLRQEVVYNNSDVFSGAPGYYSIVDALEASNNAELGKLIRADYYKELALSVGVWIGRVSKRFPLVYGIFPLYTDEYIHESFIEYCHNKKIAIVDLYTGAVSFTETDLERFISILKAPG